MIGNFFYTSRPAVDCIAVCMTWGPDGARKGTLVVPHSLREHIEAERMPSTDEALSIDGALAYAVVLSIRAGLSLTLSGDISVWPVEWGQVIQVN